MNGSVANQPVRSRCKSIPNHHHLEPNRMPTPVHPTSRVYPRDLMRFNPRLELVPEGVSTATWGYHSMRASGSFLPMHAVPGDTQWSTSCSTLTTNGKNTSSLWNPPHTHIVLQSRHSHESGAIANRRRGRASLRQPMLQSRRTRLTYVYSLKHNQFMKRVHQDSPCPMVPGSSRQEALGPLTSPRTDGCTPPGSRRHTPGRCTSTRPAACWSLAISCLRGERGRKRGDRQGTGRIPYLFEVASP